MKLKTFLSIPTSLAVLLLLDVTSARAAAIRSLNDIPNSWTGLAGDLFTRSMARLETARATEVSRKASSSFTVIDYELHGILELGGRKVEIKGARLWLNEGVSDRAEVFWNLEDPLVSTLFTVVRFLPEQNAFELSESVEGRRGERRLLLQAPARR